MHYAWDEPMILIRRSTWLRRRRLAMFGFQKTDRILDLGCGDGLDIQILFEQGYKHIIGADISPKLLAAAKKRTPRVRFVRASADNLLFKDGVFDIILADSMMYHIVGNNKAVKEIYRVLTPGGRVNFIDMQTSWLRNLFNAVTLSPLSRCIPYLRKRKTAYLAEHEAIARWNKGKTDVLRQFEVGGFRRVFLKTDYLSVIGQYQKA